MAEILKRFKRFVLMQRIEMLRSDMALADERRQYAQITVDSIDLWMIDAHRRLRSMRARHSLMQRPDVLLAEAMQGPHE